MDKRILLPTDFSKNARNALRYATTLYKDVHCQFYLLNAFQVMAYATDNMMVPEPGEPHYEASKRKSEEAMGELMEAIQLTPDNPKHRFHGICTYNGMLEAIRNEVAKKDIDVVVMGTKGATESRDRIFGTNTVYVMEHISECPVIAVPGSAHHDPPKDIVFPTDYKIAFKKRELSYLIELSKLHGSIIHVVHFDKNKDGMLNGVEKANQQLLKELLEGTSFQFHLLPYVKINKALSVFIESIGADMIVFMNRKHHFLETLLRAPLVKKIGYEPKVPILELNAP